MSKNNINSFLNKFSDLYKQIEEVCYNPSENEIEAMVSRRKERFKKGTLKSTIDPNEPVLLIRQSNGLSWERFKHWIPSYRKMTVIFRREPIGIFFGGNFLYINLSEKDAISLVSHMNLTD